MLDDAIAKTEQVIGYTFKSKSVLKAALTHSSYVNEHPHETGYDRLEFLGDALLDFIVAEKLYKETDFSAGKMTNRRAELVSEKSLCAVIDLNDLDKCVRVGRGSRCDFEGSTKAMSDIFESLLGAVYVDSGYDLSVATNFVMRFWQQLLDHKSLDFKSVLQVYSQKFVKGNPIPEYVVVAQTADAFCVRVCVDGVTGMGEGKSIAKAEKAAAKAAVIKLRALGKQL